MKENRLSPRTSCFYKFSNIFRDFSGLLVLFKRFEGTKTYKTFAGAGRTEEVETSLAFMLPSTLKNSSAQ